jgi:hypothetical protein
MRSAKRGKATSSVEVANVSRHGLWLLLGGREIFMRFSDFPWFRHASIAELCNVELPRPGHLYWPDLDVDLATESIEHPDRFPLVSRVPPNKRMQPTRISRPTTGRRTRARG